MWANSRFRWGGELYAAKKEKKGGKGKEAGRDGRVGKESRGYVGIDVGALLWAEMESRWFL